VFPVKRKFGKDFKNGKASLYDLSATDASKNLAHFAKPGDRCSEVTLIVDLAFFFPGLFRLYEREVVNERIERIAGVAERGLRALPSLDNGGYGAGASDRGYFLTWYQLISLFKSFDRDPLIPFPLNLPEVLIPFTGAGMGESHVRKKGYFVEHGRTKDGDILFRLDWERFKVEGDAFFAKLQKELR
jgi:hypothetical protein